MIEAVLFDLDGTLADTAADLGAALNRLRLEEGFEPLAPEALRPLVSSGVRGMLRAGFGLYPGDAAYAGLYRRFLSHYGEALCVGTTLFEGINGLLESLEEGGIKWGVVTNKTSRFTLPLMARLGLGSRASCMVSGDSAPRPKPAPDPLLLACAIIGTAPQRCLYVGDDLRDVEAGRAAGIDTVAVAWGYLGDDKPIEEWGAGTIIQSPADILGLLG